MQDFYVTLDLTVHVPPQYRTHRKLASAPPPSSATIDPNIDGDATPGGVADEPSKGSAAAADRLQILELHSDNPLVSYQNKLYSCYWADALGTDLLFTTRSGNDRPQSAVYSTDSFSLLAATRARLIGRPVQMTARSTAGALKPTLESDGIDSRNNTDSSSLNAAAEVAAPATQVRSSKSRQGQARFLERLAAVKAARGERDAVLANVGKTPMLERGRRRRAGGLKASARNGEAKPEDNVPSDEDEIGVLDEYESTLQNQSWNGEVESMRERGRPRGAKKAAGRPPERRAACGLLTEVFRDVTPTDEDEVGNRETEPASVGVAAEADVTAFMENVNPSDSTPAQWIHQIAPGDT